MRGRSIKFGAVAVVVLAASVKMGLFKPSIKLARRYTITNVAELAPVVTLVDQFLASECVCENTRRTYAASLEHFTTFAACTCRRRPSSLQYSDVSRKLITAFRDERLEMEAPASAELRLRVVRAFCSWCSERFQVPNPGLRIKSKFQAPDEFRGLTSIERARMLAVCKQEAHPIKRYAPILLLDTGLRNDEAINLTIGQIDTRREWINRVAGKSANIRDIPITDTHRHELAHFMSWREQFPMGMNTPLLPSTYGQKTGYIAKLSNKTIWRIVNDVCTAAGVSDDVCHPHALRHTYAYFTLAHLEESGVKPGRALIILRDLMGHKSITTTMRYLGNDKAEQYELLREMT